MQLSYMNHLLSTVSGTKKHDNHPSNTNKEQEITNILGWYSPNPSHIKQVPPPSRNEPMSPKKELFQKENVILQASFFRGYWLVSGSVLSGKLK